MKIEINNKVNNNMSVKKFKDPLSLGCLIISMNYFDVDFCRTYNADIAFSKMIIDCELLFRQCPLDNPDSGFIFLNYHYWYKFNIESISLRYTIFTKEKLIDLFKQLFEMGLYKVVGDLNNDSEILIMLEK